MVKFKMIWIAIIVFLCGSVLAYCGMQIFEGYFSRIAAVAIGCTLVLAGVTMFAGELFVWNLKRCINNCKKRSSETSDESKN